MRTLLFLILLILLPLTSCVKYEEGEQDESRSDESPLDAIKRELDAPRGKRAAEPTEAPKNWKAHPEGGNQPGTQADSQRTLSAEVYQSQDAAPWPPQVGYHFPRILFLTPGMQKRSIEEFRGRVVLIEYVSMASPSSQALAGANERGAFAGVPQRREFKSLEKYFPSYSKGINAGELVLLQILLLDQRSKLVNAASASAWVKHFDLEGRGRTVVFGTSALLKNDGHQLLGGFQLLDKNLVVRADATGERSKTLFSELFPSIARYVRAP